MNYPTYLVHFNPYHNPKNGQFASSKSGQVYGKLDKMSDAKLYDTLKKEVKSTKKEKWGWSNQWMSKIPIGPNSEKLIYERDKKEKAYRSTPEYKAWEKKVRALDNKAINGEISDDEYASESKKIFGQMPKRDFDSLLAAAVYTKNGYKYLGDYASKGGRELSIAYLEDMGYDTDKAKEYVDRLVKYDWSLT